MPDPAAPEPTPSATVSASHFTQNLFAVLSETFAQTSGIYLDRGADLFSTLDALSAEEASREVLGTTIAAHAFHTAFYVQAMERYFEGFEGKTDWQGSWTTRAVTHWDEAALDFGMTIAIHSAYHLGAIRQLAKAVKGER
ncbi:hypothetical protein [Truepera radiovictrix]|uniref:DinB-like domain-containing protein n=1 Tax=Truepera radiovictrix (strain DSM 17093 / CIP 108686 / LMG 22925 / RQ-24) TaxID=649638 RepID=D7CUU7_TRURR|nr:hypothetical protein [Truepera radiovictrix]ADI14088.1 conserved hypothetical protein [Truepera radiovictrix DSM 17093]WMT57351.1 hypothetical protein RCV51_00040 [Truepera radiovictrix]